jgi:hypothetical protein
MLRTIGAVLLLLLPAMACRAQCAAPPGLMFEQWYAMCRGVVDEGYAAGYGAGLPYPSFAMVLYNAYVNAATGAGGATVAGQCELGQSMCFSGWLRTCQSVGVSTMWITGSERCE